MIYFEEFNIGLYHDHVWDNRVKFLELDISRWENNKTCIARRFLYVLYNHDIADIEEFLKDRNILLKLLNLKDNTKVKFRIDKIIELVVH